MNRRFFEDEVDYPLINISRIIEITGNDPFFTRRLHDEDQEDLLLLHEDDQNVPLLLDEKDLISGG